MDILEEIVMSLVFKLDRWLMHRVAHFIQNKWHGRDPMTHANYLDKLRVIHKSEHFLAVNKHHDLVINTNPPDYRLSLYSQIQHSYPELAQPNLAHGFYVAHRLDYSTSGVLLVPLTKRAAAQAAKQFEVAVQLAIGWDILTPSLHSEKENKKILSRSGQGACG